MEKILFAVLVFFLTILSGYFDSRGFLHASDMWNNGQVVWPELLKSAAGFGIGILLYWLVIRYLPKLGIAASTEIQTLGWFSVTMIGIAMSSGEFIKWNLPEKAVAAFLLVGLGWLMFRGH